MSLINNVGRMELGATSLATSGCTACLVFFYKLYYELVTVKHAPGTQELKYHMPDH